MMRDMDTLREQVRALGEKNKALEEKLDAQVTDLTKQIFQNTPPVVNYVDNGDFTFNAEQYDATAFANDDLVVARWYNRANDSTSQYTEYTGGSAGTDYISTDTARDAYWNKTTGELVMSIKAAIAAPLPKNIAFPASSLFCRFQVKKSSGGISIPNAWRLRAAIWDNTSGQQKIIEGAVFDLTVTAAVGSPGSFTRKYILRVDTAMDFFYSDVLTPSQVTNQVSVTNIDNVNFVTISWQTFPEAARYRLYRHETEFNEWRLIADIVNGATSFKDVGGRTGVLFNPPGANILPRAQALFVNFGKYVNGNLNYQDAIFHIFVPTTYNYSATTNKQWLRFDMVDENLNSVTLPDDALLIDKVALGYTNGRFCYSAKDLAANATVQATAPPPVPPPGGDNGDGGNIPPPRGGGDRPLCVKPNTPILIADQVWKEARDIQIDDYILNGNGHLSRVTNIVRGTTSQWRVLITEHGRELWCSPTHRIICKVGDDEGTPAFKLKVGDQVMGMHEKYGMCFDNIQAIEVIEAQDEPVITFTLEGTHTYVAAGFVSHNLKPLLE